HHQALRLVQRLPLRSRRQDELTLDPGFTVGAICLTERSDGAILLVRLSYRDRWGAPGGLLKRGEAPEDAVRREVREETGLEVVTVGGPAVVVASEPRRVDVIFRARPAPGQDPDAAAPQSPEIVEVAWFPPHALPELQHETSHA